MRHYVNEYHKQFDCNEKRFYLFMSEPIWVKNLRLTYITQVSHYNKNKLMPETL